MQERPNGAQEERPYYHEDAAIGQVRLWERDYMLRLKAHVAPESYYRAPGDEIIPLQQRRGERIYVHAKPYLLLPDLRMIIQLHQHPEPSGAIGQVVDTEWIGMKHQEIGNAQGWYYPTERAIILWECFLDGHATAQRRTPRGVQHDITDPNLTTLWQGFERFLIGHFPEATQLVTTYRDPLYETAGYQRFLGTRGYQPISDHAWARSLGSGDQAAGSR